MDKASFEAGKTHGATEEKGNQVLNNAGNKVQAAKESVQIAGQQAVGKAQGAVDAVKNAATNK